MALVLKNATTISPDGSTLYIEFKQATGDYDVTDNPGGFGTPNPARNTLAVVLVADHKITSGDVPATIQAYNVLTVESFTISLTKALNGVLKFDILALPLFDGGGSYVDGDIVYDNTNPSAGFAKKRVAGEWVPVEFVDLIGDTDVLQNNDYAFPIPDAIRIVNELTAKELLVLRPYVMGECGKEEWEVAALKLRYVELLLKAATDAFCAQAYNEAQINIEEIFNYESQVLVADE